MPVVISNEFVLSDAVIPVSHPRILYDDVWRTGTILASHQEDGFPAINVADGLTWDFWRPTALPAGLTVTLPSSAEVDYALIAAHTLGTSGVRVMGQYHDGATYVEMFDEYLPGDDRVLAFLFEPVISDRFALAIDGGAIMPSLGIVMMGKALAMPRGMVLNHRPITLSRKTVARPNISEGGHTLGRSVRREGVVTQLAFENLEAGWIRTHFDPFIRSARTYPFGWVPDPVNYPEEAAFCWTPAGKEDIRPQHDGLQDRMNVAFEVEGIVE